jgi:hypothetical protein
VAEELDVNMALPEWRPARGVERDPARINVLIEQLRVVWEEHPEMRLGQLLVNLCDPNPNPIFYVEDHTVSANIFELRKTGNWPATKRMTGPE